MRNLYISIDWIEFFHNEMKHFTFSNAMKYLKITMVNISLINNYFKLCFTCLQNGFYGWICCSAWFGQWLKLLQELVVLPELSVMCHSHQVDRGWLTWYSFFLLPYYSLLIEWLVLVKYLHALLIACIYPIPPSPSTFW